MKAGCDGEKKAARQRRTLPVVATEAASGQRIADSTRSRWRAVSLVAVYLLMAAHIVHWQIAGSTISPIEPSEAMYTLQNGAVNAGVIFFLLAILATVIFGRFVCGWGCHIVALQDLCSWLLGKVGLKPRPFRSRLLIFVPLIAAFYMFVWPTASRLLAKPASEPLFPAFTDHLTTTEFWATFPPFWIAVPFLFICGFVVVYFLGSKGFCTYGCPYGAFFGIADKFAPGKIRVTDACNQCGHCTATCTSNVLVHAEVKKYGMVVDPGCMKCMDCVSVCPNDALYFGFGKPSVLVRTQSGSDGGRRNYSLTWTEEIFAAAVFGASYFAVWNVYQLVPMLMAIGIAAVSAYLAVRTLGILTRSDQSFYNLKLKSAGRIHKAGWVFIAVATAWLGWTAHSGYVRYNERSGSIAFESLQIPDDLALANADASQWLSDADRVNIESGKRDLYRAFDAGFAVNTTTLPRLAWFEYLSGNADQAAKLLAISAARQEGQPRAITLYFRGAMLNRLARHQEALASLDEAIKESPALLLAREERGEALWSLGRRDEAVAVWTELANSGSALPLTYNFLAGAADLASPKPDASADLETPPNRSAGLEAQPSHSTDLKAPASGSADLDAQANRITPNDPFFHWMLAQRLSAAVMPNQAEKHYRRAIQLNPAFRSRKR